MAASFFVNLFETSSMKTLVLLFQGDSFASPKRPEQSFSCDVFRDECQRQGIVGSEEVYLQVVFHCKHFTVIPKDIDAQSIFGYHFPPFAAEPCESALLLDDKQKMIFKSESTLRQAAREMLPHHNLLPDAYLLVNHCLRNSKDKSLMNIHWKDDCLQIFVAHNSQLVFANAFQVKCDEEVQYFVASVKQEFACGPAFQANLIGNQKLESLVGEFFKKTETFDIAENIHSLLSYQKQSL